jgi:hypothetical protein
MPPLARAFIQRRRWVAAYGCLRQALEAGVANATIAEELREVETALGPWLGALKSGRIS